MTIKFENIPNKLQKLNQWVLWKDNKIPYTTNGKKASTNNPDTWTTFGNVKHAYNNMSPNVYKGIGFVFTKDDNFIGVDWDKVRNKETGEWKKDILQEILQFNSYAEISPSGTGAHVICEGVIPGDKNRKGCREMYSELRYFTFTGNIISGATKEITNNNDAILDVYNKICIDEKNETQIVQPQQIEITPHLDDEEIINLCMNEQNNHLFNSLYAGNYSSHKSHSEADLALCSKFAFYTQDRAQINRLFKSSGLYRKKWCNPYSSNTINKVISSLNKTYKKPKKYTQMNDNKQDTKLDWQDDLKLTEKGSIKNIIHNVKLIIQNDPNLNIKIDYNEFTCEDEIVNDLPWRKIDRYSNKWNDKDTDVLLNYISKNYGFGNINLINSTINTLSVGNEYHPVRKYLNELKWDGIKRVDTLFIDYLGAYDNEYTRTVTRKSLLACVTRIMKNGCKFDNCVVLVGKEGVGKSTILQKISKYWFSDSFTSFYHKEAIEQMQGHWIIEIPELSAMKKAEIEQVKSFLSRRYDTARLAYARFAKTIPRQCVFFGTTNNTTFLTSSNGNRRFWPIEVHTQPPVKNIWKDLTNDVVDNLWGEVMEIYKTGEQLHLTKDIIDKAEKVQNNHQMVDERAKFIHQYLNEHNKQIVWVVELWEYCLLGARKDFNRTVSKPIYDIMDKMEGWERYKSPTGANTKKSKIYGNGICYIKTNK